jgi:tetratricopeptide (TPR) repeat protein
VYMANLLTDTGRAPQAIPLLQEALATNPNVAEAHWELGYAYRYGGMLPESVTECETARQLDPNVKINSSALNSYLYLGEYDKFLASLPNTDSPYILFYHGLAEYYKTDLASAAAHFDRAYELNPSLPQAQIGKAFADGTRHDNAGGLKLLHAAEDRAEERGVTDGEGIYKIAQAYAVLEDGEGALRVLRKSIDAGFYPYSYFEGDPLLNQVRKLPEFSTLMDDARKRSEEFRAKFGGR